MAASDLVIKGAREHNLRGVNLRLPRNKLIVFTGVSGSGKSSLAFDTLYAEGQRRYVESLSSYARQFLGQMPKPDVDHLSGLAPSISIQQKSTSRNPRSTVGTITEIYDYLRVLYARVGHGHCPQCRRPITAQSREQILARILAMPSGTRFSVLAPLVRGQKGEYRDLFDELLRAGYLRARVDGQIVSLTENPRLDRQMKHNIELVVDRLKASPDVRPRLAEAVEQALEKGDGNLIVAIEPTSERVGESKSTASGECQLPGTGGLTPTAGQAENKPSTLNSQLPPSDLLLSARYACTHCGLSYEPPTPQLFSFNSPQGMCLECDGLGEKYDFDPELLIDPSRCFAEGAVALVFNRSGHGQLKDVGRWRRHIYEGVAESLGLDLKTPWAELAPEVQHALLFGTGERHITFSWRHRGGVWKHGGTFEGLLPELMNRYRKATNPMYRRALEKYMRVLRCPACQGTRLNAQARSVTIETEHPQWASGQMQGKTHSLTRSLAHSPKLTLPEVCALSVADAARFFEKLKLDAAGHLIAEQALKEIRGRLGFLLNVGLDYLTLDRTAPTLSGGESQRIRLAGQIGCGLVGVLYVLDEPSIGLHPRDNARLLDTLGQLRDLGNTLIVVEHDEDTMQAADHVVDFGPGPGVRGGEVVATGSLEDLAHNPKSVTGQYLTGKREIPVPAKRRPTSKKRLKVVGAAHNNLKNLDVEIPLGLFVCVTGVSGSGKSSLVSDIVMEALRRDLNGAHGNPGKHKRINGKQHLDKVIHIDQSPIGRTPRSNPATYVKVLDEIRRLYTQLPEARTRGYKPGRFSFNVAGGRCEACEGQGSNRLEMDFLADVWVTCPVCEGHRFNRETLQVRFKGKSIADVLEMDIQEARQHFENVPKIAGMLDTLDAVGLDYLKLGQPSPTLSGGEAQRIKLARELVKRSTGRTLYVLDEPTTGLHFADIHKLLEVLHGFVDAGNTVLVIEHNLDVVKTADWILDLGPEGGDAGGQLVAEGTPEQVAERSDSYTGQALRHLFERVRASSNGSGERADKLARRLGARGQGSGIREASTEADGNRAREPLSTFNFQPSTHSQLSTSPDPYSRHIVIRGANQHNLKNVSVTIPRSSMTVFCGVSGSGKTSLAMDTLYAEGQRRYVESLSAYARQFVGQMQKPRVEHISGLSPAIAIEQKTAANTPRSTVGTVTEIYDYLRILWARLGHPYCPECQIPIGTQTTDEIVERILSLKDGSRLYLLAPVELRQNESYESLWSEIRAGGYPRVRVDGTTYPIDDLPRIDRRKKHCVEIVVDRIEVWARNRSRIADSIEAALDLGRGVLGVVHVTPQTDESTWPIDRYSKHFACDRCGQSFEELSPHHFSSNSPLGWCPACEGLGTQRGANPAALIRDPKLSLREGAIAAWPAADLGTFRLVLESLAKHCGFSLDQPFEQLDPRHQRDVLHGTGDAWIELKPNSRVGIAHQSVGGDSTAVGAHPTGPLIRFQYKGLYPAIEEATRVSPVYRAKLDHLVDEVPCAACQGSRLRADASAVRFRNRTLHQVGRMPLDTCLAWFESLKPDRGERRVAGDVLREIRNRLRFLVDVGLGYLTLGRSAPTLSGGESQRIRLASQVGSGLTGVLYVLDEPTIGLHPRDNRRLLGALKKLRNLGNTLVLVEHDREVMEAADRLLDFGPGAGDYGGRVIAGGTPKQVCTQSDSLTGQYLAGKAAIPVPTNRRLPSAQDLPKPVRQLVMIDNGENGESRQRFRPTRRGKRTSASRGNGWLVVRDARHHNLKNVDVHFPLGALVCVTGVSGSGKSSLVNDIVWKTLARRLHRARTSGGAHETIEGIEHINKVIRVDQQPIGNTPASNPATYTGLFEVVRELFAQLPDAKVRGYQPRRFSFNTRGGRCEACEGQGQQRIEMHFLPDVWITCETCGGARYNPETLSVRYKGRSIADVLEMSVSEALEHFANIPRLRRYLQTLADVGLDYVKLGQPAPTLSGGEAQRVKLAAELARPQTGRTLYLLDEPTTGLHFDDLKKLLDVLHRLVDLGNTVIVIEHNLDVVKTADWVIDLGPEAGDEGGYVVVAGTPEEVAALASRRVSELAGRKQGSDVRQPSLDSSQLSTLNSQRFPEIRYPIPDPPFRSYTGEMLDAVLRRGPHAERPRFDPHAAEARREGDLELSDVGRNTKMPWEVDGRRWHTRERVGRRGELCRWEGAVLERVVDRVHELGDFSDTDWNSRTVVDISAAKKSDGWFLHASTGDEWLVWLRFRVARRTFSQDELERRLDLAPLDEIDELPIYGREPRVRVKNRKPPWQEIALGVHWLREIDRPEFWKFLAEAAGSFQGVVNRARVDPGDVMPWKVLGRRWHLSAKGFPTGKARKWDPEVLTQLLDVISAVVGDSQVQWDSRDRVVFRPNGSARAWATVLTKKPKAVTLRLVGKLGQFNLTSIERFGIAPRLNGGASHERITLQFSRSEHLHAAELSRFLQDHLAGFRG